jgi:hypothetical protein
MTDNLETSLRGLRDDSGSRVWALGWDKDDRKQAFDGRVADLYQRLSRMGITDDYGVWQGASPSASQYLGDINEHMNSIIGSLAEARKQGEAARGSKAEAKKAIESYSRVYREGLKPLLLAAPSYLSLNSAMERKAKLQQIIQGTVQSLVDRGWMEQLPNGKFKFTAQREEEEEEEETTPDFPPPPGAEAPLPSAPPAGPAARPAETEDAAYERVLQSLEKLSEASDWSENSHRPQLLGVEKRLKDIYLRFPGGHEAEDSVLDSLKEIYDKARDAGWTDGYGFSAKKKKKQGAYWEHKYKKLGDSAMTILRRVEKRVNAKTISKTEAGRDLGAAVKILGGMARGLRGDNPDPSMNLPNNYLLRRRLSEGLINLSESLRAIEEGLGLRPRRPGKFLVTARSAKWGLDILVRASSEAIAAARAGDKARANRLLRVASQEYIKLRRYARGRNVARIGRQLQEAFDRYAAAKRAVGSGPEPAPRPTSHRRAAPVAAPSRMEEEEEEAAPPARGRDPAAAELLRNGAVILRNLARVAAVPGSEVQELRSIWDRAESLEKRFVKETDADSRRVLALEIQSFQKAKDAASAVLKQHGYMSQTGRWLAKPSEFWKVGKSSKKKK